jgi:hypothetical protein
MSFQKVWECLYRNQSSGAYYALINRGGKQIRRSLKNQGPQVGRTSPCRVPAREIGLVSASAKERLMIFSQVGEH